MYWPSYLDDRVGFGQLVFRKPGADEPRLLRPVDALGNAQDKPAGQQYGDGACEADDHGGHGPSCEAPDHYRLWIHAAGDDATKDVGQRVANQEGGQSPTGRDGKAVTGEAQVFGELRQRDREVGAVKIGDK